MGSVGAGKPNAATLLAIAGKRGGHQAEIIAGLGPLLAETLTRYGIDTPLRQAHFLAQAAHECDRFSTLTEYASGWAYEGRRDLGNTQGGDGPRFRGRGILQTTGRANYARAAHRLNLPLLEQPELLATPGPALEAACLYWQDNRLNVWADRDDALAVSRGINLGNSKSVRIPNGWDDRRLLTVRAKRALVTG
jgi:putative chitinase